MSVIEFDAWIGRTLFVPPIIKFCQFTRQSQYAVSRLLWFFAALDLMRIATSLSSLIIAGVFSLFMMLSASLAADFRAFSMRWFRMMVLAMLVIDVVSRLPLENWNGVEVWLIVLFAEYAATITTIPPSEDKKRAADPKAREANR